MENNFTMGQWGSRDAKAVRWQSCFWIWAMLMQRYDNDIIPKSKVKKYLHPILLLNRRSIRLEAG